MNYINLIHDIDELRKFFDLVIPGLAYEEVYFLSLSARNKYLSQEERKEIGLSRTEMFAKTIIRRRDFDYFVKKLRSMECDERGYVTKTGDPIPNSTIVVYFNINPSSMLKAYNKFINEVNTQMTEFIMSPNADHLTKYNYFSRIDLKLLKHIQSSPGTRHYLDVDFDINKEDEEHLLHTFIDHIKNMDIKYYVIETKSGFHVLMKKDTIKGNFHPMIQELNRIAKDEIILNSNSMVPLPGCLCGGFKVKVRYDL